MKLPISVVLCSYNGAKFIEEQIRTVMVQTYPVAELLVVDDASTDQTCAIVELLTASDSRIKLIKNSQNLGFSANFEKALHLASSELIAIADQDDVWHPSKLENLLKIFPEESMLVYCDSVRFTNTIPLHPKPNKKNIRIDGDNPRALSMFNTVSGHAMLIRKSLLSKALPIPEHVYYDWWLAITASCNGGITYLPEILVYQRSHTTNVTIQKDLTESALRSNFRKMLLHHLHAFKQVTGMNASDRLFFETFERLWEKSSTKYFNWSLFFFMLNHRRDIFKNKKRLFPIVSATKVSFLFSLVRLN